MTELRTALIATLPEREATLHKALLSIRPQVDRIVVMMNGWGYEQANHFGLWCCMNLGEHMVFMLDNSLKDGAKFYYANANEGYVVVIDDDIEYPPDFVERMIERVEFYQRKAVVSVMGKVLKPRPIESYYKDIERSYRTFEAVDKDADVEVIGTCGTVYHHSTCPDLNHTFFPGANSDIYASRYLKERGIRGLVVAHSGDWLTNLMPELPEETYSIFGAYSENDKELTDVINQFL